MFYAMREGQFRDKQEAYEWTITPNSDIGGLCPAVAAARGLYSAVARAARLRGERLRAPCYKTLDEY